MKLSYEFRPSLVKNIWYVTHKGKRRNFSIRMDAHLPNAHEMIYVDYGKILLVLNGVEMHVSPGECIFIPGGAKHCFRGEQGSPFDYLNIMFVGDLPQSLFENKLIVNRKCLELLEKLKQESLQETPYCREIVAGMLTELIARFLRQVEFSVPEKLPESANRRRYRSDIVNRAMKIISGEYSKPLNRRQLSRAVGIGESRLAKLLKMETGENFSSILHRQRVTAARHLISEGTFSLEEISNAVGYQYTSFFFKVFRRVTGMTPREYSRSLGEPTEMK